jgi:hypothetical protein
MNYQDKRQYKCYQDVRAVFQAKCRFLACRGFPVSGRRIDRVISECCKKSPLTCETYKEFDFAERLTVLYFEQKVPPGKVVTIDPLSDAAHQAIFDQYLTGLRTEDFSRCSFDVFIHWFLRKEAGMLFNKKRNVAFA